MYLFLLYNIEQFSNLMLVKVNYLTGVSFMFSAGEQLVLTGRQNYLNRTSNIKKKVPPEVKQSGQNNPHNQSLFTFVNLKLINS